MTEAMNAAPVAKGLGEGLSHSDTHILIGVVVVDMGVARGIDVQIDQTMTADLMQHVVEKRHSGDGVALPRAIEIQPDPHIGFAGDAMDLTCAHGSRAPEALTQSQQTDHAERTPGHQQGIPPEITCR